MGKTVYTAEAHVTGGREHGHGATSDGALAVDLRPPGVEGGTNPEQLFAVGYAACFEGAMMVVGRRMKLDVGDVAIDAKVHLVTTEERGFKLAVDMDVALPNIEDDEQAVALVRKSHEVCPYSNATRSNVDVGLTVNGHAV